MTRLGFALIAAAVALVGLGIALPDPTDRLPQCYEDQVLYRATVPGEWQCIAIDDLEGTR